MAALSQITPLNGTAYDIKDARGIAYCYTAAATSAKVATCTGYALTTGSWIWVVIVTANTYNGTLTLNINSTGAKNIYINGVASSSSNKTLPAGRYLVYYNGTNYYFRTDGYLTAVTSADDITGWTTNTPTVVTKKTVVTGGSTTNITPVTSKTVVTSASGGTASVTNNTLYLTSASFGTGASVTSGTTVAAYTSLTTGDSVSVTAGTAATLNYTARTVATGLGV